MNEPPCILVVDDNPLLLRATSRILRAANYTVIEAASGEEGLRLARQHTPDLILLDVVMDDPNGVETCKRIKADPTLVSTFVILVSGLKTASEYQAEGIESGADGYIVRPISNRELIARVQAMLRIKAAEDKLRASEAKYRTLVETADDVILLTDLNGKHLFRNPAYYTSLGYAVGDDVPLDGFALVHPDDVPVLRSKMGELLERGSLTTEYRIRHKDGHWIYWSAKSKLIYDEAHKPQTVLTIIRDITERKRADDERRASDERFRTVANFTHDWEYWVSPEGKYLYVSPSCERITGYRAEEFIQDPDLLRALIHPDDRARINSHLHDAFEKHETVALDFRIITRAGEERWVNHVCMPVFGEDGRWLGRRASNRDITDRKRAEQALQAYSTRLEQMVDERTRDLRAAQEQLLHQERLTLLGQIAGGIGHELRSPLGAISNAVYLLRQMLAAPDDETREVLDILQRQVEASNRTISSLLAFARPQPPARHATDVRAVIDAALAQAALPDNIIIQREFAAALPEVQADSEQLQIVFSNLIRNAAQAMPEGGTLTIGATQISDFRIQNSDSPNAQSVQSEIRNPKSAIEIRVTDTGVGIPPEVRERIFQPMFTTKTRGLGLGLALCKLIVEAHGGAIDVESVVGTGTTFVITLPLD